jgi:NADPH:quinone reductase-like Zn-dependent oxidoreductase
MKQIVYHKMGNPQEVLSIKEVESSPLRAGEVRVSILATPIHPSNLLKISGQYGIAPQLPETPGTEGVGRVTEVAADVNTLLVGQNVFLAGYPTWQQEVTGPASSFIALPEGADVQQLSMLMINPITALRLLDTFASLKEGDWVVQNAANSAVGGYLIQLAKSRGIRTINIVRRESSAQALLDLGADHVIVDDSTLTTAIQSLVGDSKLSLAIDAVGGESFSKLASALSYGGTIVCYGLLSMQPPTLPSMSVIFNDISVRGFWLSKWFEYATPTDKQKTFAEVIGLIARGELTSKISKTFSLDQIKEAVIAAGEGGRDGKVLLLPNPHS